MQRQKREQTETASFEQQAQQLHTVPLPPDVTSNIKDEIWQFHYSNGKHSFKPPRLQADAALLKLWNFTDDTSLLITNREMVDIIVHLARQMHEPDRMQHYPAVWQLQQLVSKINCLYRVYQLFNELDDLKIQYPTLEQVLPAK